MTQDFKPGSLVKYSNPISEQEKEVRFIVLENNIDRLKVQLVCDWYLKPVNVFPIKEFSLVGK